MAPKIDRKNLEKKIMRVGQMLRMEADVKGEPAPIITWKLKNMVLKTHDRMKVENEDYHTTFILNKLQRSDTGVYVVTAKNDSGTDEVEVEVQVRCQFWLIFNTFIPIYYFLFKSVNIYNLKASNSQ